jgi:hypothetical protein
MAGNGRPFAEPAVINFAKIFIVKGFFQMATGVIERSAAPAAAQATRFPFFFFLF